MKSCRKQSTHNPVIQPRNMSMLPNHEEDVASKASFWVLISWSWDLTIITPSQNPIQDASMNINDMCKKASICFKSPWLVVAPWLPLSSLQDNRPSGTGHHPFQSASYHPFFGRIYQRKIDLGRAVLQYLISKLPKLLFQCSHCYLGTDQESNQHRPTLPGVPKEAIPRESPRFFSLAKLT